MEELEDYGDIIDDGVSLFGLSGDVLEGSVSLFGDNQDKSIEEEGIVNLKPSFITLPTRETKLSEVLEFLPCGLIDKKITGIGATHLEMYSLRNSIIVTPTRVLAYNKSIKEEDKFLYFGSPYNEKIITTKNIKNYLDNPSITYKKFLVVADSLPKLIKLLEGYKKTDVLKDYFLMVDEVDTLQSDNYFRPVLSKVIDYYLKFSPSNRALVSATIKSFSHPELKKEVIRHVICEEPLRRNINLLQCNNINQSLANQIIDISNNYPSDKILIAFNSIQNILKTIKLLPLEVQEDCSILCSEFNKVEIGGYEAKINSIGSLSHKITFMTCAYFSGIDITDQCHLITVSDVSKAHSVLPLSRIIQIYGRCRDGILSDSIIYNYRNKNLSHTIEEYYNLLILRANKVITLLNIADELKENDANITNLFNRIRKLIIDKASGDDDNLFGENTVPLTRETIDEKLEISYFNIDALCEKMEAYSTLYSDESGLSTQLQDLGYNIILNKLYHSVSEEQRALERSVRGDIKEKNQESLLKLKTRLQALLNSNELNNRAISNLINDSKGKEIDYLWKLKKHYKYVDNEFLIKELYTICQKNKKSYRGFNNALSFWVLDDSHPLKMQVLSSFEIGKKYSSEQIQELLLPIIKYHFFKVNISKSRLTNLFNNIFRKTYTDGKYLVKGLNPREIPAPIDKIPSNTDNLHTYFDV